MKKAGIGLIALGFYCIIFAFNMDVVVGTTYNIGLMNERQNVVYLSGIIFLAGIILFGFGFSAKEESKNLKTFAISCFLSPILLLVGIKTVVFVQESIKQNNIQRQAAMDAEKYKKEMEEYAKKEQAKKQAEEAKQKRLEVERQAAAKKVLEENFNKFVDNKNGTVLQKQTDLIWQQCLVGQKWSGKTCEGDAQRFSWDDAIKLTSNFADKNDWRLPTAEELGSLVYCSNGKYTALGKEESGVICTNYDSVISPTINTTYFPETPSDLFWSSTPSTDDNINYWAVYFGIGSSSDSNKANYGKNYVRLVR